MQTFNSFDELQEANPSLYNMIVTLTNQHWYRYHNDGWGFSTTDKFNPYCFADNPQIATPAQMSFFAEQALYREGAKDIPFRQYVGGMHYQTKLIFVKGVDHVVRFEVPDYIAGWINGMYVGVYQDGSSST